MSLVIAKLISNELLIIGDTKFNYHEPKTNKDVLRSEADKYIGGLKSIMLTPGLCVSFAGEVENARLAIEGIYKKNVNVFDKNIAIDYFYDNHVSSLKNSPTDYIIATICFGDNPSMGTDKELFRISAGEVTWGEPSYWIGDHAGFSLFQEKFHDANSIATLQPDRAEFQIISLGKEIDSHLSQQLSKAMFAFLEVIKSPDIESVDGIRTAIISSANQLKYLEYIIVDGIGIPTKPNLPSSPVFFGDESHGSNTMHIGLQRADGHAILPVYYYHGKFGVIYNPTKRFEATRHPNISFNDFKEIVSSEIKTQHSIAMNFQKRILGE